MNGNQDTTQEPAYKKENMSEVSDIEELPESIYPINLRLIEQYQ